MWKCGCECSQLCLTDYITGESLFVFNPPVKHNKHKTGVEIVPSWYFIGWPFLGIPEKKKRKTQRIRHTRVKVSAQHNTALLVLGFKPGSSPITSLTFHGLSNEKTGLRKVGEESYLYLINKHPQEPLLRLYFSCFFLCNNIFTFKQQTYWKPWTFVLSFDISLVSRIDYKVQKCSTIGQWAFLFPSWTCFICPH